MDIISLLAHDNYFSINRDLIKLVGLDATVLLGALASQYNYWRKCGKLTDDGYFYSTQENLENDTSLSRYKQDTALKKLKDLGIIDIKVKGIPPTKHFKILTENTAKQLYKQNCEKLTNQIVNNSQIELQKINKLNCKSFTTNNTINNNTINNNTKNNIYKENISKEKSIYSDIINHLNLKANTNYRPNTNKTKSLINARLNEGFTLEDFKTVIDKKSNEWLGSDYEKFLRPETLFGNKFENYLNQNVSNKVNKFKPNAIENKYKDEEF